MLTKLWNWIAPKTPEDNLVNFLDLEINDFVRNAETTIRAGLQRNGNGFSTNISVSLPVLFEKSVWETLVAQNFSKLKHGNEERFNSVIIEHFGFTQEDLDKTHVLNIDLGLDESEPHHIDYFTGFEGRKGYEALRQMCEKHHIDFQFYFDPDPNNAEHARIGFVLWSVDNRPLLTCFQSPSPADRIDHEGG